MRRNIAGVVGALRLSEGVVDYLVRLRLTRALARANYSMDVRVFFSWQSDTPADRGRALIERALRRATAAVAADTTIPFRPDVDQDTRGVPGTPAMVAAILRKIDTCSVFVADVTLTFQRAERNRKSPNPNVLLELGYALRRLGPERVLIVVDTDHGGPEQLPFDLRGSRAITYSSADDPDGAEEQLARDLAEGIALIFRVVGPPADIVPPVQLDLEFSKERIERDRHDYRLQVSVTNRGDTLLRDWAVEVRFPSALLNPNRNYPIVGNLRDGRVVVRQVEANHSGPIYPREKKELLGIDYIMTHELFDRSAELFPQMVEAFFFVEGKLVASATRQVKDVQVF